MDSAAVDIESDPGPRAAKLVEVTGSWGRGIRAEDVTGIGDCALGKLTGLDASAGLLLSSEPLAGSVELAWLEELAVKVWVVVAEVEGKAQRLISC